MGSNGPSSSPGFNSLPPSAIEGIARALTSALCPLYDRGDLLSDAARLACVGNACATQIAARVFKALSPHLGQPLPDGVTENSSAGALKAACKAWNLPSTGKKAELWQRLKDQVEDSRRSMDGAPPRTCLVSAATQRELVGWRYHRISQSKAKDIFNLSKSALANLNYVWDQNGGGFSSKLFLLRELKAKARDRHGSWERLCEQRDNWPAYYARIQAEAAAKLEGRTARREGIQAELVARGWKEEGARKEMAGEWGVECMGAGPRGQCEVAQAADYIERMHFIGQLVDDDYIEEMKLPMGDREMVLEEVPRIGLNPAVLKADFEARKRRDAPPPEEKLRQWVQSMDSLEELRIAPASLLPEVEAMW